MTGRCGQVTVELAVVTAGVGVLLGMLTSAAQTGMARVRAAEAARFGARIGSTAGVEAADAQSALAAYVARLGVGDGVDAAALDTYRATPASRFYAFVECRVPWRGARFFGGERPGGVERVVVETEGE